MTDHEWTKEMGKGIKSTVRYDEHRLQMIVHGNPYDWDDNVPPQDAVDELSARSIPLMPGVVND